MTESDDTLFWLFIREKCGSAPLSAWSPARRDAGLPQPRPAGVRHRSRPHPQRHQRGGDAGPGQRPAGHRTASGGSRSSLIVLLVQFDFDLEIQTTIRNLHRLVMFRLGV